MSLSESSKQESQELIPTGTDEKIGYKNPPKATQFKPGKSGNSKGRPKGMSKRERLLKHINRKLRVPIDGTMETVTMGELVDINIINKAAKGSVPHIKLFNEMKKELGLVEPVRPDHNIFITFEDVPPEMQAAQKREDELFEQLNREELKEK